MQTDDFPTTEAKFRTFFPDHAPYTCRPPEFPEAPNFMTPDVLGYVQTPHGTAEISTGTFLDDRLYGVTFRPDPDNRSACAHNWSEVIQAIS